MSRVGADDDVDAVLFEKIRSGEYDADDPIWDNISEEVRARRQRCVSKHFARNFMHSNDLLSCSL